MIEIICHYTDPPHSHLYPDDWLMGDGEEPDPKVDPRWQPSVYSYFEPDGTELWRTVVPLCDDQALDEFTKVATIQGSNPRLCSAKRPDGTQELLSWQYDKQQDLLTPF